MPIKTGDTVSVHYVGTFNDGTDIMDRNGIASFNGHGDLERVEGSGSAGRPQGLHSGFQAPA